MIDDLGKKYINVGGTRIISRTLLNKTDLVTLSVNI